MYFVAMFFTIGSYLLNAPVLDSSLYQEKMQIRQEMQHFLWEMQCFQQRKAFLQ
jgi:hypothetical protein